MEELRKELEHLKRNNPVADVKRAVDETLSPIEKELRNEANELQDAVTKPAGPAAAGDTGGEESQPRENRPDETSAGDAPLEQAGAKS